MSDSQWSSSSIHINTTGMHCCACAGVCYHIPPATYCVMHGGVGAGWPRQWPYVPTIAAPTANCTHCHCITTPDDHVACCNCGNRQKRSGT